MRVYRIVVETFEPGNTFPILIHVFQGKTSREAEAYVKAHEKSDVFFWECGTKGVFAGTVRCSQRRSFAGWVEV